MKRVTKCHEQPFSSKNVTVEIFDVQDDDAEYKSVIIRPRAGWINNTDEVNSLIRGVYAAIGTNRVSFENQNFDILFKGQRLPFCLSTDVHPSGIFPFKDDDTYIELRETGMTLREYADTARLPSEKFFASVYRVKDILNDHLRQLGSMPLDGTYFVTNSYICNANWIAGFEDNESHCLSSDYYNNHEAAKIRYVGTLN